MDATTQKLIDTYKAQGPLSTGQIGDIISSSSLQGAKPLSIPQTPVPTTADGISGASTALVDATKNLQTLQQAEDQRVADAQAKADESKTSFMDTMKQYLGVQGSRADLEQQAGIDKKTLSYNTALTNLEASQRAQTNELRALDTANMTDAGRAAAQRDINRKYAFEQADLSLVLSVANRDLVSAQNMVNRKIELALEPLKTQLDFTRMFYEDNKADLSKAEERAFGLKTKQLERQYEEQKSLQETIGKLQMNAASQGADPRIVQAIGRAKTVDEAVQAAGQYAGDILERQIKLQQLNKLRLENRKLDQETDLTRGVLTDADIKTIDGSPQGKKLTTLADLKRKALKYQSLVDTYGIELSGANKTLIDSAYADLQVAWKEAANLGALTGPDLQLISDSVKPVTGIRGIGTQATGGGAAGVSKSVDQMISTIDKDAGTNYALLTSRNPKYSNSEYVNGLGDAFFATYRNQLKEGEILVRDKNTGEIGAIPTNEFNESKYQKI